MARIKIRDLPRDKKVSKEELKKALGGLGPQPEPPDRWYVNKYLVSGLPRLSLLV
jgi:hypothetical protein